MCLKTWPRSTSYEVRRFVVAFNPINMYFYSHTSYEVRQNYSIFSIRYQLFLLTHLIRGATFYLFLIQVLDIFLLTHLIRGATCTCICKDVYSCISTHTPHTRCDLRWFKCGMILKISTHTPHTRCDDFLTGHNDRNWNFYSHTSYEVRLTYKSSIYF